MKHRSSNQEFVAAVAVSRSYEQLRKRLGLGMGGKTTKGLQRRVQRLNLSTAHFVPDQLRLVSSRLPTEVVFSNRGKRTDGSVLRQHMIRAGIPYVCAECGRDPLWNGHPLTLPVDHKNGDSADSNIINLRFLCPNCHSQTETYCGRNATRAKKRA